MTSLFGGLGHRFCVGFGAVEDRLAGVAGSLSDRVAAARAHPGGGGETEESPLVVVGGGERVVSLRTSVERGGKVVEDTEVEVEDRVTGRRRRREPRSKERRLREEEVQAMILRDAARGIAEAQSHVFKL